MCRIQCILEVRSLQNVKAGPVLGICIISSSKLLDFPFNYQKSRCLMIFYEELQQVMQHYAGHPINAWLSELSSLISLSETICDDHV